MSHNSQNTVDIQILIVDDNRDFANVFAKLLQIKGFSVTVETSFKNGLQHLKDRLCHIVFVDIPLPGYDERQILNSLKEKEIFKKSRVFLFSSIDLADAELDEWKKEGLYLYLKKPVKRDVMIQVLEDIRAEINPDAQTQTNSIAGSEEPAPEQLEKSNRLEKQIEELEDIRQSASVEEYSLPEKTEDIPKEPDVATERAMDYGMLKNIISDLRLQSTLKPAQYGLNPRVEVDPKDREIIKKEIEKTLLEISALKDKILLFEDVDSQHAGASTDKKNHKTRKKSATAKAKKRKMKKKSF